MKQTIIFNRKDHEVIVYRNCSINGRVYVVSIPISDYVSWKSGKPVEKVMPYLNISDRYFLIHNRTPSERKLSY